MSLEQKVGQLMGIGVEGTTVTPELRTLIRNLHIGGVVLFERNCESPSQVLQFTHDLQQLARENGDPGLLISIDQEGGVVARLKEHRGFTEFPGAMAIAATGDIENAKHIARAQVDELCALGIHINFAPDLDVNNNPANPVISTRSFGSDPGRVAAFGAAYIQATQDAGILAVGKHFPGHGDTGIDSHVALPTVPHDRVRLERIEFVPFRAAINARVAGIMSTHVTFPAIEPRSIASTLSPRVLTDLLRDEMKYAGLIFTDSLEMGALTTSGFPPPIAASTALQAGADMLLFNSPHDVYPAVHAEILNSVRSGKISLARLDDAVRRVLLAKQKVFAARTSRPALDIVGSPETKKLSYTVAAQAVTIVRDEARLIPVEPQKTLVIEFAPLGLGARIGATMLHVNDETGRDAVVNRAKNFERVIIATSDVAKNRLQADWVAALLGTNSQTIVIATRSPYDALYLPPIPTYVAVYGANPPMLDVLADVLLGKIPACGKLPVEF